MKKIMLLALVVYALFISTKTTAIIYIRDRYVSAGDKLVIDIFKRNSASSGIIGQFYFEEYNGFAANITLVKRVYTRGLKTFATNLRARLEKSNYKIELGEIADQRCLFEYTGEVNYKLYHYFVIAQKRNNFLYLITATTLHKNWNSRKEQVLKSLDSFTLKDLPPKPQKNTPDVNKPSKLEAEKIKLKDQIEELKKKNQLKKKRKLKMVI